MSAAHVEKQVDDSLVKGIAGSQKNANATATTARNASKGRFKKSYKVVIFAILVLLLLNSWRQWYEKRLSKPEEVVSAQSQGNETGSKKEPVVTNGEATWNETTEDGAFPVGVWSETTQIPPGCGTEYNAGNGTLYKIRYRFYTTEWKDHIPGQYPPANEVQFMLLQNEVTAVPFVLKCS